MKVRKVKAGTRVRAMLFCVLMLAVVVLNGGCNVNEHAEQTLHTEQTLHAERAIESNRQNIEEDTVQTESELSVHFMDIGQGDATLIICDGEAMLVDAGNNSKGTQIQNYLNKQGVQTLKYVIGTHPDADHIGGLDVVLYKFDCKTIIMPDEEKNTETYRDVVQTMEEKGYRNTLPIVGDTYQLGSAQFTILSPGRNYSNSNDNSVAFILTHGDNRFLFTGDAEEAEADMLQNGMNPEADVYKVSHHGSRTASSKAFLETVQPNYAVISCGEGNTYGHPHAEVLNNLRGMGVSVFRTDEQGTIVAESDGTDITWNSSPSESWQTGGESGGPTEITKTPAASLQSAYVCNTSTGKFHKPGCSSVEQMKDSNRLDVTTTRDELISQGFEPCKRCNP